MNVPPPLANECCVVVPFVPVIAHGPANTNEIEKAPFASAVAEPLPLLQAIVIAAFAIGAPVAAVPLIVALDAFEGVVLLLSLPPPHPASMPAASAIIPVCDALSATFFIVFIDFLH
ncbi:hypothetical protein [Burkholderia ubonensis]|uniref:hypothetical protein n=1 Tax=Burkholderia ubonensis TaxID=101571 RepID=UPI001E48B8E2|nr:hypothetical protein [Burkholderia ubonensis]MDY7788037.1 hypothetical protein [Burkholderia ubonensis]